MKIKYLFLTALFFLLAPSAGAHVVVKPSSVNVSEFQTFDIGVPSEKDASTTMVRLVLPEGLKEVTPNVKPGWTIDVKKDTKDNATEIDWIGGSIPTEERDDFYFSAQAPASATTLKWKAYQTYSDGSVVAWDQEPGAKEASGSGEEPTPYSQTMVVNDLKPSPAPISSTTTSNATVLSVVALALAALSLGLALRKR